MFRRLFAAALLLAGCGSGDGSPAPAGAGGESDGKDGGCPDVSGQWTVAKHCDASLVGLDLTVSETDCALTFAAPFNRFMGSVDAARNITLSGPQDCTGAVSATTITMVCTPGTCDVSLER